jgi:hypothetical protein
MTTRNVRIVRLAAPSFFPWPVAQAAISHLRRLLRLMRGAAGGLHSWTRLRPLRATIASCWKTIECVSLKSRSTLDSANLCMRTVCRVWNTRCLGASIGTMTGQGKLLSEGQDPPESFPTTSWSEPAPPFSYENLDTKPMHMLRVELKR